ncbi:MAG: hypothetical protein KC431_15430, partial [Myxococcales bacterium]|nr:hypothetical protein [Myxococcales bacterium]
VRRHEPTAVLAGHRGIINAVAFSTDGTLIAAASGDGSAWLWDARSLEPIAPLAGSHDGVLAVAFSPDGDTLATGDADGSILLWPTRIDALVRGLCRRARRFHDYYRVRETCESE